MIDRSDFLASRIGRRWSVDHSCWHFAAEVQAALFGRDLPSVALPEHPSWRWMIETIEDHPERRRWREVVSPIPGLISAADGALVAMGRAGRAAHIGVWLAPERLVIHCDEASGVRTDPVPALRLQGWGRVRFFEPATD
ncbi:hypothetical protein [Ancylobacter moscoviensis]